MYTEKLSLLLICYRVVRKKQELLEMKNDCQTFQLSIVGSRNTGLFSPFHIQLVQYLFRLPANEGVLAIVLL